MQTCLAFSMNQLACNNYCPCTHTQSNVYVCCTPLADSLHFISKGHLELRLTYSCILKQSLLIKLVRNVPVSSVLLGN